MNRTLRWEHQERADYGLDRIGAEFRDRLYSEAGKAALKMDAEARDRQIIETLARELMGWITAGWQCHNFVVKQPVVFIRSDRTYVYDWNPLTDWRAAGEVLEAIHIRSDEIPSRFAAAFEAHEVHPTDHRGDGGRIVRWTLMRLSPRAIAEAAFEALEPIDGR